MKNMIDFICRDVFSCFCATVKTDNGSTVLYPREVSRDGNSAVYKACGDGVDLSVTASLTGDTVLLSVNATAESAFAADDCVCFTNMNVTGSDGVLDIFKQSSWWTLYSFHNKLSELRGDCQSAFVRCGDTHFHFLALTGNNTKTIFRRNGGLCLNVGCGVREISGTVAAVTAADSAVCAAETTFINAKAAGAITVPLRRDREFPALFNGFGWCSWNAFYHDVTSEGIYKKLDEFREKNIPVKWIIIDDGWSQYTDRKLDSFDSDPVKFPEGLKECIRRIKEEYGIGYVGVWHAFNGYWEGVNPASSLAAECADILYKTKNGWLIPSPVDEEKAFAFYDRWHTYLADCGVDFLKVDNQSSTIDYLRGETPTASGAKIMHSALDRSVTKHFGNIMINCMGMDTDNFFARPSSTLSRNSDDFFPNNENGFVQHICQNAYNALWHSALYHSDYDMWWSRHESAVQSGVLRAISGGPVYVSDKVGESDAGNILPVCDENGDIGRLDDYAKPTSDCIYTDCAAEGKLFKIYNRSAGAFAVAVYNLSGKDIDDTLDFGAVNGLSGDFVAYEYFTQKFYRVNESTVLPLSLGANGVYCFNIYPVLTDGGEHIMLGDTSKYVSVGRNSKRCLPLSEIAF